MNWLDNLERRFGRWAIPQLTLLLVFGQVAAYLFELFRPGFIDKLVLYPEQLLQGEVWRLVTFLFIPPPTNVLFIIFALLVFYMFGSNLEYQWGEFKYNIYIFMGWFAAACPALLYVVLMQVPALQDTARMMRLGQAQGTNAYIGLTVLFAFATVNPRFELLIFFVLPVQVRFLAWIAAGVALLGFLFGGLLHKAQFIMAMANYALFFGPRFIHNIHARVRREQFEEKITRASGESLHRCAVCGLTEEDDDEMWFRVCSQCDQEFCEEHLADHDCQPTDE